MRLNVPLKLQQKGSVDCGVVCMQMILDYYDQLKSLAEIKKTIELDDIGSYSPQMGTYFQNMGFSTELITLHPGIFTLHDKGMSQNKIKQRMKIMRRRMNTNHEKKVIDYFLKYQESGGQIKVKIPDIDDIKKSIRSGYPLIALLTSHFLTSSQPKFNFHFNVITGFSSNYVYVNDPLPDSRGGSKKYKIEDFLFGVYTSTQADLDNGCFIKIKPINSISITK